MCVANQISIKAHCRQKKKGGNARVQTVKRVSKKALREINKGFLATMKTSKPKYKSVKKMSDKEAIAMAGRLAYNMNRIPQNNASVFQPQNNNGPVNVLIPRRKPK